MLQDHKTSRRAARGRPARRGDERELALLATAERLLSEDAFDAASLAEIAQASGVSRQGFYFYFASKEALLSSLILQTLDLLAERLPAPTAAISASDPALALHYALHGAADLWYEHRAVLMAATELSREPTVFDTIKRAQLALTEPTAMLLRSGTRVRTDDDARELAEMFTWMAERNFYVLSRERPPRERLHRLADQLLDVWVSSAGFAYPGADDRTRGEG